MPSVRSARRTGETGYHRGVIRPDTATKHAADVSSMFDEVSPRYDLINDVLTVGNDRLWRVATTKAVAPRKGMRVLDLAAGTGTSSAALAAHGAHVVAADFSEGMLAEGRKRHSGNPLIEFVHADAMALPFEDNSFDAATISYGLRNISDPRAALAEMYRVVKPGGRIVIAEFSTPPAAIVRGPYTWYGRNVLPRIAGAINREAAEAYRYLNESIEAWPTQDELAAWLREAGFERVAYRNLTFGIVALHRGFVPRETAAARAAAAATQASAKPAAAKQAAETKQAAAAKPAAKKSAAAKPAAGKPAAKKSAAAKPAAAGPATAKPAAAKPAGAKPAAAKAEPQSGGAKSGGPKSAGAKAPGTKAAGAKPKAAGAKPAAEKKPAAAERPAAPKKSAASKPAASSQPSTTETGSSDATGGTP